MEQTKGVHFQTMKQSVARDLIKSELRALVNQAVLSAQAQLNDFLENHKEFTPTQPLNFDVVDRLKSGVNDKKNRLEQLEDLKTFDELYEFLVKYLRFESGAEFHFTIRALTRGQADLGDSNRLGVASDRGVFRIDEGGNRTRQ